MSSKDYIVIIFGLLLYAVGWSAFLLPNKIVTGGAAGISSIIYFTLDVPIYISYAVINIVLLIAAIKILGLKFCLRTIFSVSILTALLTLLQQFIKEPVLKDQAFMSACIGGMMCGGGIGIVFTANGSTGGTDILAAIVNKYRNISLGRSVLMFDILIICSSYFIFHDLETMLFGLVVMAVFSFACDMVINSARGSVQFLIFSEEYNEIASLISRDVRRGVTLLDGMGWYSKKPKKVLVVLAKRSESVTIFRIVKTIDPNAFISQSNVIGVFGEGFDHIK